MVDWSVVFRGATVVAGAALVTTVLSGLGLGRVAIRSNFVVVALAAYVVAGAVLSATLSVGSAVGGAVGGAVR